MNYQQTIDYLYNTLPMFSRMGSSAFKKDLTNIRLLCKHLGNPQHRFKSVHVGGTNGKGSVSHMLAAIFQTAGYKTGLYTSPHLYDFRERIRVDGIMADEEFVIRFVENIQHEIEKIQPSFFEITVAMAFEYFVEKNVDVAVVEVGLGGRLDSTNIIVPELSIITNVGYDHMDMLGDRLEQIAFEKAGIIKSRVPVVVGERRTETDDVFQKLAHARSAPIIFSDQQFNISHYSWENNYLKVALTDKTTGTVQAIASDLTGLYQLKNILTARTAVNVLKTNFPGLTSAFAPAMKSVKKLTGFKGRWDIVAENPDIVLDVAHNKDGIQHLLTHVKQQEFGQLHIVIGTVKDKDIKGILEQLPANAFYYFTQAQIPRALAAGELQKAAAEYNLDGPAYADVNEAVNAALEQSNENDLIVVCGSIFLVAEVNLSKLNLIEPH